MRRSLLAVLTALALAPTPASAEVRAEMLGADAIKLDTQWGKGAGARLFVGKSKPVTLARGSSAGTVAIGHGRAIVAFGVSDAAQPFRIVVVERGRAGKPVSIARPIKRHDLPFAVAATPTPDGFAVFFQEVQADDPTAAHTYLVELDDAGVASGPARSIEVPWSLAAAAWNGSGYHLALIYPGDGKSMRLSMVSVSKDGEPQQHPDWASGPGFISDVHLVASGDKVRAFYRGGAGGDRLLESDVTTIGNWGSEPAKAKDHGALPFGKAIAITSKGTPAKI